MTRTPAPGRPDPGPQRPVRTYVVFRYAGPPIMGLRPPDEVVMDLLGTVEARTAAEAYARAEARWPDVPARAFRVRTARGAGVGALGVALARDVERDPGR